MDRRNKARIVPHCKFSYWGLRLRFIFPVLCRSFFRLRISSFFRDPHFVFDVLWRLLYFCALAPSLFSFLLMELAQPSFFSPTCSVLSRPYRIVMQVAVSPHTPRAWLFSPCLLRLYAFFCRPLFPTHLFSRTPELLSRVFPSRAWSTP